MLRQWRVPGMSLAVVDGDDVFTKGFGLAALPSTPVTPETLFYVGSTTKAHTAAALALLMDSGRYPALARNWSTPIASLIRDDFVLQDERATAHTTLLDAVSHRTGMAPHDDAWHREMDGRPATVRDVVRNLRHLPLSAEPRAAFHYCSAMYVVLAHAMETLTGRWLGHILRDHIWLPLGMTTTYMDLQAARDAPVPLARSYLWHRDEQRFKEMPFLPVDEISGAGGVMSSVVDYAKWLRCLVHETPPLSKAVHKDIRTPRAIVKPGPGLVADVPLYSLGWGRTTLHGHVAYTHAGSTYTYGALVWWFPDLTYGVVALANGAGTSNEAESVVVWKLMQDKLRLPAAKRIDLNERLRRAAEQARHDIERADDILFPDRPEPPLPSSAKTAALAGTYVNAGYGTVELSEQANPRRRGETMLVANRTQATWRQQWQLQHVSGNYWTLYMAPLDETSVVADFQAARFEMGVDGQAAALEVDFYDRQEDFRQGKMLFRRVG